MSNEPTFINQKELSRRWNMSPRTLERWRCYGEGPKWYKIGGSCLYKLSDIEAYEEQQAQDPTAKIFDKYNFGVK